MFVFAFITLLKGLNDFTDIKELTPTIINRLIQRIEFHQNEKKRSRNNVKVYIYVIEVGLFELPVEEQLLKMIDKIKKENIESKKSA